jgi:23S rRNA U2552 (ribose-2'-O)-methylase RlmE/FtsJ
MNFLESIQKTVPTYETVLPFSKKLVKFQPFKVKDAKNISIILQEENKKLALNAMVELLTTNSSGANILDLCLADAVFLFLQIRAKSVDERLNLIVNNEKISVFIPDILHKNNIKNDNIILSDKMNIVVETPTIKDLIKLESLEHIDLMKACIKKVVSDGEIFYVNKFVSDEIKTLLDNLPMNVLPKLENFLKNQPELYVILQTQTGSKEVSGFLSFFTFR